MKTKRWAMLAGGIMLVGLLLLVTRAVNKAIQLDPKNAVAYANRCAALINKGESDQALSDCNKAILLDPKNAPTRFGYQ